MAGGSIRSAAKRVAPPQAGEAREVGVGRVEDGLVLDGEGGQVGVRRQVAGGAELAEEVEKETGEPGNVGDGPFRRNP
jgi:hypothetical protein